VDAGVEPPPDGGLTYRPPLVPSDDKGWPIGWPKAGVLLVDADGATISFVGGPDSNPATAEHWRADQLTPEQMKTVNQAHRIAVRDTEWVE